MLKIDGEYGYFKVGKWIKVGAPAKTPKMRDPTPQVWNVDFKMEDGNAPLPPHNLVHQEFTKQKDADRFAFLQNPYTYPIVYSDKRANKWAVDAFPSKGVMEIRYEYIRQTEIACYKFCWVD